MSNQGDTANTQDQRPLITLAMMVKNEEERLGRALASAAPWVDEIVVVDTGSTDRTVEIAEQYGAKIHHHPWQKDFALHRNQTIGYSTGQWILIMDADEELMEGSGDLMREVARTMPEHIGCVHFELYNDVEGGQSTMCMHPRLFRNDGGFRYDGAVHNVPFYNGKTAGSPIKLWHYGYNLDAQSMEQKHQRRLDMIGAWLEREPDNYAAHAYMAQTYLAREETRPQAVDEAKTALKLGREQGMIPEDFPRAYYPLIAALCGLRRYEEAVQYANECIELIDYYPDPYFLLSYVYFQEQDHAKCVEMVDTWLKWQDYAAEHPEKFRFVENMTVKNFDRAYYRLVVSLAVLGRGDEALEAYGLLLDLENAESYSRQVVEGMLNEDMAHLAVRMLEMVQAKRPEWKWIKFLQQLARGTARSGEFRQLRQDGLMAQEAGDHQRALELLRKAADLSPNDWRSLTGVGRSLVELGRGDEAVDWFVRGLDAFPGHAPSWRTLGELYFARGDYEGAVEALERALRLEPGDSSAEGRLNVCRRRLERAEPQPTVRQKPPRMVVFLVSGMSAGTVRQGALNFLLGSAWGEFFNEAEQPPSLPAWASLYTGRGPAEHGIDREQRRAQPLSLADLKVVSVWEVMARSLRVGMLAAPLCCPPPRINGWAAAGQPAGLLSSELVHPASLTPRLLAREYRPDYLLSEFDDYTFTYTLRRDRSREAMMYKMERNKFNAVLDMPAVDVLVIGATVLDLLQRAYPRGLERVFLAYQQVYAWMESLAATLQPESVAVCSERGFSDTQLTPSGGGFYCLNWLRGEDNRARLEDIAPALLTRLGLDPGQLGQPRA